MPIGLDLSPWVYAYAVLFALAHISLFYYFLVRRTDKSSTRQDDDGRRAPDPPAHLPDVGAENTLRCQHCGVENEVGYRFCRFCIEELGDGAFTTTDDSSPRSRGMF